MQVPSSPSLLSSPREESPLIWTNGFSIAGRGSVLVRLAQNGYTREAHIIIQLSKIASLVGQQSDGGLPELTRVANPAIGLSKENSIQPEIFKKHEKIYSDVLLLLSSFFR